MNEHGENTEQVGAIPNLIKELQRIAAEIAAAKDINANEHGLSHTVQFDAFAKVLEALRNRLSTDPAEFTQPELEICASLQDTTYQVYCYYPPAALAETMPHKLTFDSLRQAARAELKTRIGE